MKRYIGIIAVLLYLCPVCGIAQPGDSSEKDSISVSQKYSVQTDSVRTDSLANGKAPLKPEKFSPNSKKATIYAAIFPGLGQIYNRKYWKLPLVYGGFLGCAYAITWNGTQYNGYRRAYLDFISGDPERISWQDYVYGTYQQQGDDLDKWDPGLKKSFSDALKNAKDYYRRYRDLSIIITVGVYALSIIDAYVDAQLFNFDISPDLSMQVAPVLFDRTLANNTHTIGIQLSFAF